MQIPTTTLWIPPDIHAELMYYAWKVDAEVGGLGRLVFDQENNDIFVEELYLIEQEVHQTECTLSAEGTAKLYEELIANDEADKIGQLSLWWHSHKNMQAKFSTTDDECMRTWPGQYVVSLVVNRKGEMTASLTTKSPILVVGEIDVEVNLLYPYNVDFLEKDVEAKVSIVKPKYNTTPIKKKQEQLTSETKKTHNMTDAEWVDEEVKEWASMGYTVSHGYDKWDDWDTVNAQLEAEERKYWKEMGK
jgi:proteasome lid subunit RPN8/RPN11